MTVLFEYVIATQTYMNSLFTVQAPDLNKESDRKVWRSNVITVVLPGFSWYIRHSLMSGSAVHDESPTSPSIQKLTFVLWKIRIITLQSDEISYVPG